MKEKKLILILGFLGLSACAAISRDSSSGYATYQERGDSQQTVDDFYRERSKSRWLAAEEDLGLQTERARELTEEEAESIRQRVKLKQLEEKLDYSVERKQYFGYRPYFKNDADRIRFLSLPSREARERFAQSLGLHEAESGLDPQTVSLIERGDIAKGMTKKAVFQSWGEPEFKEIAGNELYGNERWHYKKLVSTEDGYKTERRILYFEGGRVSGWETTQ